jgi:hypothetical protein
MFPFSRGWARVIHEAVRRLHEIGMVLVSKTERDTGLSTFVPEYVTTEPESLQSNIHPMYICTIDFLPSSYLEW